MKDGKTSDALEILRDIAGNDPARKKRLDAIRVRHQIIQDIYDARQRLGLSQRVLAELSGVSESTIARIERVETTPRFSIVLKLAKALKVKLPKNAESSWKLSTARGPRESRATIPEQLHDSGTYEEVIETARRRKRQFEADPEKHTAVFTIKDLDKLREKRRAMLGRK